LGGAIAVLLIAGDKSLAPYRERSGDRDRSSRIVFGAGAFTIRRFVLSRPEWSMGIESADLLRGGGWSTGLLAERGVAGVIERLRITLDTRDRQSRAADRGCTGTRVAAVTR